MELPQQAVNALIQRTTESSSESESHPPPNPSTLYANSLLKQFVAQTQMLNAPSATLPNSDANGSNQNSENNNGSGQKVLNGASSKDNVKRKRGRPKKTNPHSNKKESNNVAKPTTSGLYSVNPNVSPDSGIQNSPDHASSPEPCPSPNSKPKNQSETKKPVQSDKLKSSKETRQPLNNKCAANGLTNKLKEQNKLPMTSNRFDRLLYANADRVLYPPRRKVGRPPINRKGPGRPPKHKVEQPKSNEKPTKENNSDKATASSVNNCKIGTERHNGKLNKAKKCTSNRDRDGNHTTATGGSDSCSAKVNGVKDVTTKRTKSKLLYEICERVSKRLEMNNRTGQQKEVNNGVKQEKSDNKSSKNSTRKSKSVLDNKLKLNNIKAQYTTLKNAKLMHSKHKHKKHKKCKFKILKPLSATVVDPKINIDIEKLIADFVKYCYITSSKPSKENIPEILKALKKVSKKRKTSEYNERKKKKQTVSNILNKEANSNEQRLPLKKRHYHLSAGSESKPDTPELNNSTDGLGDSKLESKTKTVVNKNVTLASTKVPIKSLSPAANVTTKNDSPKPSPTSTAKYIPVIKTLNTTPPKPTSINNNEYEAVNTKSKSVGSHIDEAIEACITRFSGGQENATKTPESVPKDEKITTTTPKKRHRFEQCANSNAENTVKQELPSPILTNEKEIDTPKMKSKSSLESVVNELKMKRTLTGKVVETNQKKSEKKSDAVTQIMTRKKNRLEDLTSSLVSKIASPVTENGETQKKRKDVSKVEEASRDSVIKYPTCKKIKPSDSEKLDFIDAKPTGIFMPSTDLEILIPVNTIELKKETPDEVKITKKSDDVSTEKTVLVESAPKPRNSEVSRRRIRKRRAINRTGFPTVKKKKKKVPFTENYVAELDNKADDCDRVPKTGEEYSKFLQRTEKCYTTTEKMQKSHSEISLPTSSDVENAKWEALSECDSLPQDERTEIEQDDILRLDLKQEKMNLRSRDLSPTTSVDTLSDKSRIKSLDQMKEDLDDLPLEIRIRRMEMKTKSERARRKRELLLKKRKYRENLMLKKRKLRDISPASSIEHFNDKRLREESASASSDEFKRIRKIPRWRKRYLVAGLFSDYYKEDE